MISIKNLKKETGEIENDLLPDLTPLLDVMFMLIIFLILTMNIAYKQFDIDIPQDKDNIAHNEINQNAIDLVIFNSGDDWSLNGKKINNFNDLKSALTKLSQNPKQKINIISDKSVSVERLINLLIFMKSQGIKTSDIVVK